MRVACVRVLNRLVADDALPQETKISTAPHIGPCSIHRTSPTTNLEAPSSRSFLHHPCPIACPILFLHSSSIVAFFEMSASSKDEGAGVAPQNKASWGSFLKVTNYASHSL